MYQIDGSTVIMDNNIIVLRRRAISETTVEEIDSQTSIYGIGQASAGEQLARGMLLYEAALEYPRREYDASFVNAISLSDPRLLGFSHFADRTWLHERTFM